jgi:phage terminase small subunit
MPIIANAQRERFAQELAKGASQTDAQVAAGFAYNTGNATRLANRPEVKARVQELLTAGAERAEITVERVLAELAKIGFSDIRKLFTDRGSLKRVEDLDDDAAACLSSIEVVTKHVPGGDEGEVEHVAKIKLWDKRAALVDLGKHLGMFVDKLALTDSAGNDVDMGDTDLARLIVFQLTKAAKQGEPTQH